MTKATTGLAVLAAVALCLGGRAHAAAAADAAPGPGNLEQGLAELPFCSAPGQPHCPAPPPNASELLLPPNVTLVASAGSASLLVAKDGATTTYKLAECSKSPDCKTILDQARKAKADSSALPGARGADRAPAAAVGNPIAGVVVGDLLKSLGPGLGLDAAAAGGGAGAVDATGALGAAPAGAGGSISGGSGSFTGLAPGANRANSVFDSGKASLEQNKNDGSK